MEVQCTECYKVVEPVNGACPNCRTLIVAAIMPAGSAPMSIVQGATAYPALRRSGAHLLRYSGWLRVLSVIAFVIAFGAMLAGIALDNPGRSLLAFTIAGEAFAACGVLFISGAIFGVAGQGAEALADLAANSATTTTLLGELLRR